MNSQATVIGLAVLCVALQHPLHAGDDAAVSVLLSINGNASEAAKLGKQWLKEFSELSTAEVQRLSITSSDPSKAIAAACEHYRRGTGHLAHHQRLVGFIESQSHTLLTAEFETTLIHSNLGNEQAMEEFSRMYPKQISDGVWKLRVEEHEKRYTGVDFKFGNSVKKVSNNGKVSVSGSGSFKMVCLYGRKSTRLARDADNIIVSDGQQQLRLTAKTVEDMLLKYSGDMLMVEFRPKDASVLLMPSDPSSYAMLCFDVSNGKLLWESTVWAGGINREFVINGPRMHHVQIFHSADRIAVMGFDFSTSYLEVFNSKSGAPIVRFASNLWKAH